MHIATRLFPPTPLATYTYMEKNNVGGPVLQWPLRPGEVDNGADDAIRGHCTPTSATLLS